ncbi:MAG: hypothetical protein NZM31_09685 [Gemmatales bacterium]|nr:hypothetical protein [Gemmatales bacterium]MDW8387264.1 hypothetical protein [Gemmatales bacterium]
MKNLLALLAAVVIIVLVVGYFLNWYSIVGIENQSGGHRLQIDVNTDKIKADLKRGKEKLKETWEDFQELPDHAKTPAEMPAWPKTNGEKPAAKIEAGPEKPSDPAKLKIPPIPF